MQSSVAEAKQKFSEVLRASVNEPQKITKRGRLVTAVLDAVTFQQFQTWQKRQDKTSRAEVFVELRQLCKEEQYTLTIPRRRNRKSIFQ